MALPYIPEIQSKSLSLDQVVALLEAPSQQESDALFPDFSPTLDFIK